MQNATHRRAHYAKWQVCRSQRWRVFAEASPFPAVRNGDVQPNEAQRPAQGQCVQPPTSDWTQVCPAEQVWI